MAALARAAVAGLAARATTSSLADLCTVDHVQASLPDLYNQGIDLEASSVQASPVYNSSLSGGAGPAKRQAGPSSSSSSSGTTYSYCSINVTYNHPGRDDSVTLRLAFPEPSQFENRWYVAGGGGYSLSSSTTGGLEYNAASGATSAGYDAFEVSADNVALTGNGSVDWDNVYAFGYVALGEMTMVAKPMLQNFYGLSNSTTNGTKVYSYFEGCSDGGRQGMSQVQRWGAEYDGAITGAPAFRYAQQQVNHVFSSEVEYTLDYYPPPCALDKIVNATIEACDPLDGKTDGVVARTDLCMLQFNLSSIIGESYYCAGTSATSAGFGFSRLARRQMTTGAETTYEPTQNGTVNAKDVAVAQAIYDGLHNSQGERAYLSWQIGSQLEDAVTQWSNSSNSWELDITSTGGEYVARFVQLLNESNISTLEGTTYDTLVEWMEIAMLRYYDSLQTTVPDLTPFMSHGGKLIHFHGESDPSVPSASSVHYWQSVMSIMYPNLTFTEAVEEMSDWYQFYLIPGAAHCGANSLQPNGPYPEDNMNILIDWVENGVKPSRLNATGAGTDDGSTWELCQWPQRPLWPSNSTAETDFECVFNQEGYDTWTYSFPAFKLPVY
ncbi:tannase [Teratosphaeria destructans]|uniref:Carboxylic ester hydrolase n=1 Tax=Teratosphaeria destructans TaxID=418781 RepID=A0A9W7SYV5_9PEZI|nr:tannase [Teratosphaeria destructans]